MFTFSLTSRLEKSTPVIIKDNASSEVLSECVAYDLPARLSQSMVKRMIVKDSGIIIFVE